MQIILKPDEALAIATDRLARTAPEAWSEFLLALTQKTDLVREECIASPKASLENAQGRAQAMTALLRQLQTARAIAGKIQEKHK